MSFLHVFTIETITMSFYMYLLLGMKICLCVGNVVVCNSNNVMDSFVVPPPLSLGLGRGLFTGLYQASVRLVPDVERCVFVLNTTAASTRSFYHT